MNNDHWTRKFSFIIQVPLKSIETSRWHLLLNFSISATTHVNESLGKQKNREMWSINWHIFMSLLLLCKASLVWTSPTHNFALTITQWISYLFRFFSFFIHRSHNFDLVFERFVECEGQENVPRECWIWSCLQNDLESRLESDPRL